MGERCVPSLIVINSTINQLESKVSLITTHCLRLFVVVYRVEMLYIASEVMVSDTCVYTKSYCHRHCHLPVRD